MGANDKTAATYHGADLPIGTPVTYWPGFREGPGRPSFTRSNVWELGGQPVVLVKGHAGGVALTHIERRVVTGDETELAREQELRDHINDLLGDVEHFEGCKADLDCDCAICVCTCLIGRIKSAIDPRNLEGAHP